VGTLTLGVVGFTVGLGCAAGLDAAGACEAEPGLGAAGARGAAAFGAAGVRGGVVGLCGVGAREGDAPGLLSVLRAGA